MNIDEYRAMVAEQAKTEQEPEKTEEVVETKVEETVETPVEKPSASEETKEETPVPQTFKIGDQEVTLDELQRGYLRQQDYTQKTQEVSSQRKQLEKAAELLDVVKSNPEALQAIAQKNPDFFKSITPEALRVQELEEKLVQYELKEEIDTLSKKYPDFDARVVLNEASTRKMTNLEDVYLLVKGRTSNQDKPDAKVDVEALKAELRAELLKELKVQSEPNTGSIISASDGKPPAVKDEVTLSDAEKRVADMSGISYAEYAKWRDKKTN